MKGKAGSDSTDPGLWNNIVNKTWDNFQTDLDNTSKILKPLDTGRRYLADKIHPYAVKAGDALRKGKHPLAGMAGNMVEGAMDTLGSKGFEYITDPGSMGRDMAKGIDEGGWEGYKKFAGAPIQAVMAIDEVTGLPTLIKHGLITAGEAGGKELLPLLYRKQMAKEATAEAADRTLSNLKKYEAVPRQKYTIPDELRSAGRGGKSDMRIAKKMRKQLREDLEFKAQLESRQRVARELKPVIGRMEKERFDRIVKNRENLHHSREKTFEELSKIGGLHVPFKTYESWNHHREHAGLESSSRQDH